MTVKELAEEIEAIQSILAESGSRKPEIKVFPISPQYIATLESVLEVLIEEHRVLVGGVSSGAEF